MGRPDTVHPAMPLMRHEARGVLSLTFARDLEVHDAGQLAKHEHRTPFAWILHPHATFLGVATPVRRLFRFAAAFVQSYGADECRFFFWTGTIWVRCPNAGALDAMLDTSEECMRERAWAGELADRGVA